jgi:purine-binding chemotaxis protein CheW
MNNRALKKYCTFHLDKYYFGIEVEQVQEIIKYQQITPVSLAPPAVKGLINLRGQIVTAVDLRCLLELPGREEDESPMNIVVHTEQGAFSLLVDRIGDVLELEDDKYESPPENLEGIAQTLIRCVYKLDNALLMTMEIEQIVSIDVLNRHSTAA